MLPAVDQGEIATRPLRFGHDGGRDGMWHVRGRKTKWHASVRSEAANGAYRRARRAARNTVRRWDVK